MGHRFTDAYSLLHFAVGVVVRHWQMSFWVWIALHTVFEWVENTKTGMHIINTYVKAWPGGKPKADTLWNSFGDTVWGAAGWMVADWTLRAMPE